MWKTDSNWWTRPFPAMPTPRYSPSATSYKHWLVVAGGTGGGSLSTVEVLDIDSKQWSTAPSTPIPWYKMKSTIIGDTWYLMGGQPTTDVHSVSLEALVSHSASDSSTTWNKIAPHKCTLSSPLSLEGSLLALGGWDPKKKCFVSTIQRMYLRLIPGSWQVNYHAHYMTVPASRLQADYMCLEELQIED